jgi:LEA14-like dessication related protein
MKKILIALLILISAFAIYISVTFKKLDYDFTVEKFTPVKLNAAEGGIINLVLSIVIKNPFFFSVPVQGLYYEIYYKDSILGKSADTSGFTILSKQDTTIKQSVDLTINKTTLEVAKNYLFKKPTDFTAKVYVKVFGINIKLTNLKFTY